MLPRFHKPHSLPKDTKWSRCERVASNWAKRRLLKLRRALAWVRPEGQKPFRLFEFRLQPKSAMLSRVKTKPVRFERSGIKQQTSSTK